MLHKFFEEGDWFSQKKLGYGAGWPIAWQGWVVLGLYVLAMTGLAILIEWGDFTTKVLAGCGILLVTILLLVVAKRRTKGGWRSRP